MKKLFIIGTGRNGSKLTAKVLSTCVQSKCIFGEIHSGLDPKFFMDVYMGISSAEAFKKSRDGAMKGVSDIYIEKNHLVVPILNYVLEAYNEAVFLYVSRNPKDIVRSLYSRDVYTGHKNKYENGRLRPNKQDRYYSLWKNMHKFEKVCWYVYTMITMCEVFLNKLPESQYRTISYSSFVVDRCLFKLVFDWLGLDFDIEKINSVLDVQVGSSARSENELNFKINKNKVKNTQHWKDWSEEKINIYMRFFEKW